MRAWHHQRPGRWHGRYDLVIGPQYRHKAIFGTLRKDMGTLLRERCTHMGLAWVEGHARPDYGQWYLSMPPKSRGAHAVGRWKGKAAIRIQRAYLGWPRNCTGLHCWARGYWVSTVGFEEAVLRQDIRHQEEQEKRAAPLALGDGAPRR
jgi:putative transposase